MSESTNEYEKEVYPHAWARIRAEYIDYLAEFWGTFVMISFGDAVVAQTKMNTGAGDYLSVDLMWGIAVMLGFFASGGNSGGHLNPAVTVASATFRGFPWKKVPGYMFAQFFGAFLAAFLVFGTYKSNIDNFEGHGIRTVTGDTATAGIFCTFSKPYLTRGAQFVSELVASAFLQFGIFSITDNYNAGATAATFPFALMLLITAIGGSFGVQTGFALNMARDLAPRVAATILGYGGEMWSQGGYYFWVPIVAPFLGTFIGGGLYDIFCFKGKESPINQPGLGFKREPVLPINSPNDYSLETKISKPQQSSL